MHGRLVGMNDRRAMRDGGRGIEHRGQDVVDDIDAAAGFLRDRFAVRDHGGDLLADETHGVVEDPCILGIHCIDLVARRREQYGRRIRMGQHRMHARHGPCC